MWQFSLILLKSKQTLAPPLQSTDHVIPVCCPPQDTTATHRLQEGTSPAAKVQELLKLSAAQEALVYK